MIIINHCPICGHELGKIGLIKGKIVKDCDGCNAMLEISKKQEGIMIRIGDKRKE